MKSDQAAATGRRIGRYEITGELGRGGMGIVYRGEDKLIGREVAIKTLAEVTPELRERFYVEAKSGILSHPNIVTVYELGEDDGSPFIAMEYLPGDSLEKLLQERGRLSMLETLAILEQICAGLGYAHKHGLLHRDIKPSNVIVMPDGRAKIVDFGIARLADDKTRLTRTDAVLGSFHYIAPERLKGEANDGRADIWSVGVILYQMITGQLPFRGKDASALYRVIHEPYIPLHEVLEDVPEGLTAVLDRALAKDVESRYATAEEMALDLLAVGEHLKGVRMQELLITANRLFDERQFASARTSLLQIQRIDPGNTAAKSLLQSVQVELSQLRRSEQLQQIVEQAEDAFAERQYDDALDLYLQAAKLDVEDLYSIGSSVEKVQALKEQSQQVRSLREQANEASSRGDLPGAQRLLEHALQIDAQRTDLRNDLADVVREIKRREDSLKVEDLLRSAREEYSTRRYTETIARLRSAAEIDPTHAEVQQLLFTATARQKEEQRRVLLEKSVAEIHECLDRNDLDKAQARVNQALEAIPSEIQLLLLKTEIEKRKRDAERQQVIRTALFRAQELTADDLEGALAVIDAALEQAPASENLLQVRSQLLDHLGQAEKEKRRARRLQRAHEDIAANRFDAAIRGLEAGLVETGESPELTELLAFARAEQTAAAARLERETIWREAQRFLRKGSYQDVVTLLEPVVLEKNDAALAAVLESARRELQELAERIQAVLASTRALASTDAEGALHLIEEQPPSLQAHEEVAALREKLTAHAACKRSINAAMSRIEQAMADGQLRVGFDEFEGIAKVYGQSAELAAAIERCEMMRRNLADSSAESLILTARRLLEEDRGKAALQELRRNKRVLEFASEPVKTRWRRVQDEAASGSGKNAVVASGVAAVDPVTQRRGIPLLLLAIVVCLVAATLLGALYLHHRRAPAVTSAPSAPPPAVSIVKTYLVVDASPWATVLTVRSASGAIMDLGQQRSTPLRLEQLPVGGYEITLVDAGGGQHSVHCDLDPQQHLCATVLAPIDVQKAIAGEQP